MSLNLSKLSLISIDHISPWTPSDYHTSTRQTNDFHGKP